jgi:hypothetical protein
METIIVESPDEALTIKIKEMLDELNVSYKTKKKKKEKPYDPEFVKMVLERAKSARQGNTVPYDENLKKELFG